MRKILLGTIWVLMLAACKDQAAEKTAPTAIAGESTSTPPPVEFADQKYIDMGKKALEQFAAGNIDGWASMFAENIKFRWSAGDSLTGKAEVVKYWKDRRANVIESIEVSNDIWLPVKINEPQSIESKGTWLLNWHRVKATYKNKESLTFWVHIDMHYNNEGQVDEVIQYVDRAPIQAAVAKKK
ncbi:nuclear transport factor 2 family protein [Niastella populi]|uniref:SnoaL-like domain-containing protein n=1 Tax=Niastella populi TaxID=550983 RepID=A0A1V9EPA4_9BACT|nr:nuclear transport factor 2 family protein [Niastella populi]OQP47979.1 hypothetical protein A4R26_31500 [Niastella populi]